MEDLERAFVDYASWRTDGMGSRQFTTNQGRRNFNKAANSWKGKSNFNWTHAQMFTSPWNDSFSTYSSSYQMKLEKALIGFDSHQEKRLSSLRTQLRQQQDDMIRNLAAQMNFTSTNDTTREERQGKGIKSPSKLLSPKYLSQSSLAEQNETKEEGNVKTITTECENHETTVKSKEEFGEEIEDEIEDEIEEEDEDCPKHFDTFPTMKELRLGPRRKPSNPGKICNFMERVKELKVFVGNFTYECDFMVLEDTTSVIDHDLGSVIFRKPFVEATGLVFDKEEGTIMFEKYEEKIMFRMPYKMEMFKHIDFTDMNTDRIPYFVIDGDDDSSKKPTTLIA
ncbi:hypothetical protein Tco_1054007 [Tanacetum coccineum]|uniref:Protein kinase-like domain, concanavalin A-like lectin/glucanase domain protein n=1 Tax=Tanacetum coccineum TaxID=301880 RepID=A0ABQ5GX41_9ASTR